MKTQPTPEEIESEFAREMRELIESGIPAVIFELGPLETFQLVSLLQLALRHPAAAANRNDVTWTFAREFSARLEDTFSEMPVCRELIRRGWLKEYDA